MVKSPSCANETSLLDHLHARLTPSDEAQLIAHLDICQRCQQTLQILAGDEMADTARIAGEDEGQGDATLERLLLTLVDQRQPATASDVNLSELFDPPVNPSHIGRLAHYEITRAIGYGGMGIALHAIDDHLNRMVCIKILRGEVAASDSARQRFFREARAAAAVRSDHVVTIHAVDQHRGRPYLVMEYVEGKSLQQHLAAGALPLEDILRISRDIAAGLTAAHARGLVHRDIKPANILIEASTGRAKLTDFGLARAIDDETITRDGMIAGTPEYMSPEQAKGAQVDERSDLFSLGCVMYAMCYGHSPFRAEGTYAVLHRITHDEPIMAVNAEDRIPGWLVQIISRLLAKQASQRLPSAAELKNMLDERIAAPHGNVSRSILDRTPSRGTYLTVLTACGLLAAIVALQTIVVRIRDKDGKETVQRLPRGASVQIEHDGQVVASVSDLTSGPEMRVLAGHKGIVWNAQFAGNRLVTCGEDSFVKVWDRTTGDEVQRFDGHATPVYALAISPDGNTVLSGCGCRLLQKEEDVDWTVCLWEIESGRELHRLHGQGRGVTSVDFSSDGSRALIGTFEGTVKLWDVGSWREISQFSTPAGLWSVCFSPDDNRALTAGGRANESAVRVWDLATGQQLHKYVGHRYGMWHAEFLPQGDAILSAGQDGTVRHWNVKTQELVGRLLHDEQVARVALSRDGQFVLTGTWGGTRHKNLRLWRIQPAEELVVFSGHDTALHAVALSPDGRWAASGGHDGSVRLWKVPIDLAQMPANNGSQPDP